MNPLSQYPSPAISKLALSLADSPTLRLNAKASQLRAAGEPVIHLGGGEPESPAPDAAVLAAMEKLKTRRIKYTAVGGTARLKKAVLSYTLTHYGKTLKPENILVSGGAKQALYNFLVAAVNPGDEVVFPSPYWVSYPEMIRLCGGVPVAAPFAAGSSEPSVDSIAGLVTNRTKAVIINSPNNPSGAVYSAGFIKAMAAFCAERGLYLVMDDIYHQLVFGAAKPVSCYGLAKDESRLVVINGVSKLYGMTGFRIGWAVGDAALIAAMNKIQGQTTSCPSDLSQEAAAAALEGSQDCVTQLCAALKSSRDALLAELAAIKGVRVNPPEGTFYCLPDFSAYNKDSGALCEFLMEKALVVTVPGKEFGAEGHLRLSYCGAREDIIEGARRIRWALDSSAPKEYIIGGRKFHRTWA